MRIFASILEALGSFTAFTGTKACNWWIYDEPKMPNSLMEK